MNATENLKPRQQPMRAAPSSDDAGLPTPATSPIFSAWTSPKIHPRHLDLLAVVYVRQSTTQQVRDNRESRERQYGLADHAVALGWSRERVVVIDDDTGTTATTAEHRSGFHQLLAEVTLGHVGIVLSIDMARMARCCKDWHHLLEVCGIFGTVLADHAGIYDPNDSNDRFLLGLKGTMSEYELVTMRNRLGGGALHKARRGALFLHAPVGYVKVPPDSIALDPDEQARSAVQMVFDKFDELGSGHAVLRYFWRHGIKLGIRPIDGPTRGELEWRRPTSAIIFSILNHPFYAGCYAYGRCPVDLKHGQTHKCNRKWVSLAETKVVLPNQVPAYITWERYQSNQVRMQENRSRTEFKGATRRGTALLAGIVVCPVCGRRMTVGYSKTGHTRYDCQGYLHQNLDRPCRGSSVVPIDALVTQQLLRALEPASLELSLRAAENIQRERDRLTKNWQQQIERAHYAIRQAERHYRAVDPENRLVARTLERRWEEALCNERQIQEDFDRFRRGSPPALSAAEQRRIHSLSADIPQLWNAPTTSMADRKDIIRALVDHVIVQVRGDTEYVDLTIHWAGGYASQHTVLRPLQRFEQLEDRDRITEILRAGNAAGLTAQQMAARLNAEGYHTPSQRSRKFTKNKVTMLLRNLGIRKPLLDRSRLGADEWWLSDLAVELPANPRRLHHWVRRGFVHARKDAETGKYWILWADADELARLRKLRDYLTTEHRIPYPQELKRPKNRPPRL